MNKELPVLLIGIGKLGYRGHIGERCLSKLVGFAQKYGVEEVLSWIDRDSGLLSVPTATVALDAPFVRTKVIFA